MGTRRRLAFLIPDNDGHAPSSARNDLQFREPVFGNDDRLPGRVRVPDRENDCTKQ